VYREASSRAPAPTYAAILGQLSEMSPRERLQAYRSGALTRRECTLWAARYPEEAPLVNGEMEWIALALADLLD
jgi:hypothetical protein